MTNFFLCKAVIGRNGIEYESAINKGLTLTQTVEDDKKYGTMKPANGKYFTYAVFNEDNEMTIKEVEKAVQFGQRRWRIYANTPKFKRVKKDFKGVIDFRIEFRTTETDPDKQLNDGTIMYHYYPINNVDNPFRGLCVVNSKYFFTSHGNSVTGEFMSSKGVPVQYLDGQYGTIDFDQVYGHEIGHGLGLSHDTEENSLMSWNYGIMAEYPSKRDQVRMEAKYGKRLMSARHRWRWLRWLKSASDR